MLHAASMPTFWFVVEEVLSSIDGFEGLVIAGPVPAASAGSGSATG